MLAINKSISGLNGVGKTREAQLNKLGIYTLSDLVYFFPRAYENRENVFSLATAPLDVGCSFMLTVATEVKSIRTKNNMTLSKFRAYDDSDSVEIVFFNSPYVKDIFHTGAKFRFFGKLTANKNALQIVSPKYEAYVEGVELPGLVPIYPLTNGISSKIIDKIIKSALLEAIPCIIDPLPDEIRLQNELATLSYSLKNIHFPESQDALRASLKRLAFDEMLAFGIGISFMSRYKKSVVGAKFFPCDLNPLTALLPYELTASQKSVINDIYRDTVLNPVSPMSRIIVGDVGSGKTICAVYAIYIAIKSGFQVALMAPTEILATQHYNDISNLLSKLGINSELLIGSTSQKEKNRIYSSLSNGSATLVIGTHALISDKVDFKNLGLVITDEQHRFGVAQRAKLKDKSEHAHLLVMSATPIPRTLALTMYGDLDISNITEMPIGRQRVDTFVVDEGYRERLLTFISRQVENGGQCYVVCPAIEDENDDGDSISPLSINEFSNNNLKLKNVLEFTNFLKQKLPHLKIEFLHGRMKPSEKDDIMNRFSLGKLDLLVSTTVIEVGVNVPNASLMIVEDADRFGLSQLHQLRGRVGRGNRKSYCVLVSGSSSEKSRARLEIMRTTYNGYEIAEKDLMLRGPGDFFADSAYNMRQSGGFQFKIAKLCDDYELFGMAFKTAKNIVEEDPDLSAEKHKYLKQEVEKYISPLASTIS